MKTNNNIIRYTFVLSLCIMMCQCVNTPRQDCEYEFVKIIYDNGDILRVVPPKTEDLKEWSKDYRTNGFDTLVIYDKAITKKLCEVISKIDLRNGYDMPKADSIGIVLDSITTMYAMHNPKDIDATVLLSLVKFTGEADSLYLYWRPDTQMRLNNLIIPGDTVVWNMVNNILKGHIPD